MAKLHFTSLYSTSALCPCLHSDPLALLTSPLCARLSTSCVSFLPLT